MIWGFIALIAILTFVELIGIAPIQEESEDDRHTLDKR